MSEKNTDSSEKILNLLYPGYSKMSEKRKRVTQWSDLDTTLNLSEIEDIFEQMKDPNSPLYQEGASDKEFANIAAIYVKISKHSNERQAYQSNEMERGGGFYGLEDCKPVYHYRDKTPQEVQNDIRRAVEEYKETPKISIKNILKGIKKYEIDFDTALIVNDVLKKMSNPDKGEKDTKDNKEMEI